MNKADLIADVQQRLGVECSKAHAERVVQAVLAGIERGLQSDGEVQLVGFGTFQVKQRAARVGRRASYQTLRRARIWDQTWLGFW